MYAAKFHNTEGYLLVTAKCIAEAKWKIKRMVPGLYIKSIKFYDSWELYINAQK